MHHNPDLCIPWVHSMGRHNGWIKSCIPKYHIVAPKLSHHNTEMRIDLHSRKETISYLENVVRSTSIIGGIFLCTILFIYDSLKQIINGSLLYQINISSLIILVGVAYEIQKTIRSLYRNILDVSNTENLLNL